MLELIPNKYFEVYNENEYEEYFPYVLVKRLTEFFRFIYSSSSQDIKIKTANKFVVILREGHETQVNVYLHSFFRSEFLTILDKEDTEMIKRYILTFVERKINEELFESIEFISKYFTSEELRNFFSSLTSHLLSSGMDTKLYNKCKYFINQEYYVLSDENQKIIIDQIEKRIEYSNDVNKKKLEGLKEYLISGLPF